jgi:hypothetical protein
MKGQIERLWDGSSVDGTGRRDLQCWDKTVAAEGMATRRLNGAPKHTKADGAADAWVDWSCGGALADIRESSNRAVPGDGSASIPGYDSPRRPECSWAVRHHLE